MRNRGFNLLNIFAIHYMGTGTLSVVTDGLTRSHCTYCGAVFNPLNDHIIFKNDPEYEDE